MPPINKTPSKYQPRLKKHVGKKKTARFGPAQSSPSLYEYDVNEGRYVEKRSITDDTINYDIEEGRKR